MPIQPRPSFSIGTTGMCCSTPLRLTSRSIDFSALARMIVLRLSVDAMRVPLTATMTSPGFTPAASRGIAALAAPWPPDA